MRCWTTKDTPGLSPLDRKYGLAVFSQGWTTGIVALGVFSVILEKLRWSQPTSKENQRSWFSWEKKIQETRIEFCVTMREWSRYNHDLDESTTEINKSRVR